MISVCMATYNGEQYIEKQLISILQQLTVADEVIIVDDHSSDQTLSKIKAVAAAYPTPVKLQQNPQNLGPVKSFEKALAAAQGDQLLLADQDDEWLPEKVACLTAIFAKQHSALILHDGLVIDQHQQILDPSWNHYNHNHVNQGVIGNLLKNAFTGAMMAVSQELAQAALPFPNELEMHDQWLFLVARKKRLPVTVVPQPLIRYLRHGGNVTGFKKRTKKDMLVGRYKMLKAYLSI